MKDLLRAPWSNQPVRSGVRFLAWLFVACGVSGIGIFVYFTAVDGLPPLKIGAVFIGGLYMTVLFLSSAIHGKAPHGWIPWETKASRLLDAYGSKAD